MSPRARSQLSHPLAVEAVGYTHPGHQRPDNEDAFAMALDERLFIVADGMGGRNAGDVAAHLAVDELLTFFRHKRAHPRAAWPFPIERRASFGANLLHVGFRVVNQKLREAAARDPALRRMGATLGALAIGETQLVAAHVGDVRIYRIRAGAIARLTRDHSVAEEMKAARPDLHPDDIDAIAPRNVVTRALGSKDDIDPTVYVNTFAPGDLYLLCSDGLWGSLDDERIAALATAHHDLEQSCQSLLDAANEAGGPDNLTAVLVRVSPR
jgi:serine/threonine protein phosphatase PrpC